MTIFPGPSEATPDALRISVAVTLADAMAWDRQWTRSKEARRFLSRCAVAGLVAAAVLAFGAMLVARAVLAGGGCDLDEVFDSNARLKMLLITGASIVALEIAAAGLFLWSRQRSIEATYRAGRVKRPGVDPADPDLSEHFDCTFNSVGCRFDTRGLDQGMLWVLLSRVEETADHMFIVTGPARAYVVPKRDVPPAAILAIRDFARENGKLASP